MTPQHEAERFLIDVINIEESSIEADQDLLMSGILDSLAVIRLVHHLENSLGVKVPYVDIHPGNFETLNSIGQYFDSLVAKASST
jgi:acyl carrier protein